MILLLKRSKLPIRSVNAALRDRFDLQRAHAELRVGVILAGKEIWELADGTTPGDEGGRVQHIPITDFIRQQRARFLFWLVFAMRLVWNLIRRTGPLQCRLPHRSDRFVL
jgi:hypothetical protein